MKFNLHYKIFYLIVISSIPLSIWITVSESLWLWLLFTLLWSKIVHFLFLQIGLHRYFSHNSFTTGRKRHVFLALGTILTGQGSPITWSINHLYHHKHSDTDEDIHSPQHGWLHTVLLWPLKEKNIGISPKHLVRDKLILWIHKNYFLIWIMLSTLAYVIDWKLLVYGLLAPAGWSLLQSNVIGNLFNHLKIPGSYQNFDTKDQSWNNKWVQFFQVGEGLHNNHHYNMKIYNQAMMNGEYDPAAVIIERYFIK
jgi:stearoyl-CoA desaturase (delta-9 desaturase)